MIEIHIEIIILDADKYFCVGMGKKLIFIKCDQVVKGVAITPEMWLASIALSNDGRSALYT